MRIAWDVSHLEFTIEDHYYYSRLKRAILESGGDVRELRSLKEARDFDVLVINYPEKKFRFWEARLLERLIRRGLRVIVLGYYNNEDGIADIVNSLTRRFGIVLNPDRVVDPVNNFDGDEYLIRTSGVLRYGKGVSSVMMPCSASVSLVDGRADAVVLAEETARASSGGRPIIMAGLKLGRGELIVGGTCSFWDNSGILFGDNRRFAMNLLFGEE